MEVFKNPYMPKRTQESTSPVVVAIQAEAKRRKLTAYGLAKATGLRIQTMQRLLAGQGSPTIATLDAVAGALGRTVTLKRSR